MTKQITFYCERIKKQLKKKTTNKYEYLLSMKKIKHLTFALFRKNEINSSIIETIKFKRRRRKKNSTNDNDTI